MLSNNNSFFIGLRQGSGQGGTGSGSNINIDNGEVTVSLPLDLYVDDNNNVYAGRKDNNAMLIYVNDNEIYTRKVV